jgi:flagellar motility protein MotE (MotC chaperone)
VKKLLIAGLVMVALFGISAAASWYLRERADATKGSQAGSETQATAKLDRKFLQTTPSDEAIPASSPADRSGARPSYTAGAEEAVQLATSLRERLAAVRDKENQLAVRQKHLDLVYEDITGERGAIDDLRKQLADEMKALEDRTAVIDKRATEFEQQHKEVEGRVAQMKKDLTEMETAEQQNFGKMGNIYDSMEPDRAASILLQMANGAKMDVAVKILASMKERQAASVLAALPADSGLAAQLLDKLRTYKKAPKKPAGAS